MVKDFIIVGVVETKLSCNFVGGGVNNLHSGLNEGTAGGGQELGFAELQGYID